MIWAQGLVCFAIWIGYGVLQSRRSAQIRDRILTIPRSNRVASGVLHMLIGGLIMFASFFGAVMWGGFTPSGMNPITWLVLGIAGLAFVHAQTMSMAMLVSLVQDGVTSGASGPSDQQGPESAP